MVYEHMERYTFVLPDEQIEFSKFKRDLEDAGVKFDESGDSFKRVITIENSAIFHKGELFHGHE